MNLWALPLPPGSAAAMPTAPPALSTLSAAADMVAAIGDADFGPRALAAINAAPLRAASWSVYQLRRDQAPLLHLSGSRGVADTTRDCFAAYQRGLYRGDRSFDGVRPGHAAVLRMHADEAPSRDHREAIYLRHGVLERLSVVQRSDAASLLAINVYHHQHQGRFEAGEVEAFAGLAPLLLASVQRHLQWVAQRASPPVPTARAVAASGDPGGDLGGGVDDPLRRDLRGALLQRCGQLTERELDVCERLLRGWSYDGIAADLGLSLATVKTYRARAFQRLGMHFKSELFAAFVPRC